MVSNGGNGAAAAAPPSGASMKRKRPAPGSWSCGDGECHTLNSAHRQECKVCGLAKPEDAGGTILEGFGPRTRQQHRGAAVADNSNKQKADTEEEGSSSSAHKRPPSRKGTSVPESSAAAPPPSPPTPQLSSSNEANKKSSRKRPAPGSWNCVKCQTLNSARRERCKICDTAKPSAAGGMLEGFGKRTDEEAGGGKAKDVNANVTDEAPAASAANKSSRLRGQHEGGGSNDDDQKKGSSSPRWSCHACTLLNSGRRTRCKACKTPRKQDGKESSSRHRSRRNRSRSNDRSGNGIYRDDRRRKRDNSRSRNHGDDGADDRVRDRPSSSDEQAADGFNGDKRTKKTSSRFLSPSHRKGSRRDDTSRSKSIRRRSKRSVSRLRSRSYSPSDNERKKKSLSISRHRSKSRERSKGRRRSQRSASQSPERSKSTRHSPSDSPRSESISRSSQIKSSRRRRRCQPRSTGEDKRKSAQDDDEQKDGDGVVKTSLGSQKRVYLSDSETAVKEDAGTGRQGFSRNSSRDDLYFFTSSVRDVPNGTMPKRASMDCVPLPGWGAPPIESSQAPSLTDEVPADTKPRRASIDFVPSSTLRNSQSVGSPSSADDGIIRLTAPTRRASLDCSPKSMQDLDANNKRCASIEFAASQKSERIVARRASMDFAPLSWHGDDTNVDSGENCQSASPVQLTKPSNTNSSSRRASLDFVRSSWGASEESKSTPPERSSSNPSSPEKTKDKRSRSSDRQSKDEERKHASSKSEEVRVTPPATTVLDQEKVVKSKAKDADNSTDTPTTVASTRQSDSKTEEDGRTVRHSSIETAHDNGGEDRRAGRLGRKSMIGLRIQSSGEEIVVLTPPTLGPSIISTIRQRSRGPAKYTAFASVFFVVVLIILLPVFFDFSPPVVTDVPVWQPILAIGNQLLESIIETTLYITAVYLTLKKGAVLAMYFVRHVGLYVGMVGISYAIADITLMVQYGSGGADDSSERLARTVLSLCLCVASLMSMFILQGSVCTKIELRAVNSITGESDDEIEQYYKKDRHLSPNAKRRKREKTKDWYHRTMYFAILGYQVLAVLIPISSVAWYMVNDVGSLQDFNLCRYATSKCVDITIRPNALLEKDVEIKWDLQNGAMILSILESIGAFAHDAFVLAIFSSAALFPHNPSSVGIAAFAAFGKLFLAIGYLINTLLLWTSGTSVEGSIWSVCFSFSDVACASLVLVACFRFTPTLRRAWESIRNEDEANDLHDSRHKRLGCKTLRSLAFSGQKLFSARKTNWAKTLYISALSVFLLDTLQAILVLNENAIRYGNTYISETFKFSMHICLAYAFVNYFAVSDHCKHYCKSRYAMAAVAFGGMLIRAWQMANMVILREKNSAALQQSSTPMDSFVQAILFFDVLANLILFVAALVVTDMNPIRSSTTYKPEYSRLAVESGDATPVDNNTRLFLAKMIEGDLRQRARTVFFLYLISIFAYSMSLSIFDGVTSGTAPYMTATFDHTLDNMMATSVALTDAMNQQDTTGRALYAILPRLRPFVFILALSRPGWEIFFHYGLVFSIFCFDGLRKRPRRRYSLVTAGAFAFHAFALLVVFLISMTYSAITSSDVAAEYFEYDDIADDDAGSTLESVMGIMSEFRDEQLYTAAGIIPFLCMVIWFVFLIPMAITLHMLWKGRRRIHKIVSANESEQEATRRGGRKSEPENVVDLEAANPADIETRALLSSSTNGNNTERGASRKDGDRKRRKTSRESSIDNNNDEERQPSKEKKSSDDKQRKKSSRDSSESLEKKKDVERNASDSKKSSKKSRSNKESSRHRGGSSGPGSSRKESKTRDSPKNEASRSSDKDEKEDEVADSSKQKEKSSRRGKSRSRDRRRNTTKESKSPLKHETKHSGRADTSDICSKNDGGDPKDASKEVKSAEAESTDARPSKSSGKNNRCSSAKVKSRDDKIKKSRTKGQSSKREESETPSSSSKKDPDIDAAGSQKPPSKSKSKSSNRDKSRSKDSVARIRAQRSKIENSSQIDLVATPSQKS